MWAIINNCKIINETARQRLFFDLRMALELLMTGSFRDFLSFSLPSHPLFMISL
ncbi:MAG: hypothetical protein ACKVQW_09725 [Pyrinomonadaceae bacterium]